MPASRLLVKLLVVWLVLFAASRARAEVLGAPVGGKPVTVPDGRVVCGAPGGGWAVGADPHTVRPPATEGAAGQAVDATVAPGSAACAASKEHVTLLATGSWPSFDTASVVLAVDDARIEARGKRLRGVQVRWRSAGAHGSDTCLAPQADGAMDRCVWGLGSGLPADPTATALTWLPAGARGTGDEVLFDADGHRAAPSAFELPVARVVVSLLLRPNVALDAALGTGSVPLRHPEAVIGADCAPATCAVDAGSLVVGSLPPTTSVLPVRLELAPHVSLREGGAMDSAPTVRVPVLRCPLTVASGPLLRGVDTQTLVVRVEGRCASEVAHLRFLVGTTRAETLRAVASQSASYVVLRVGRAEEGDVPITATREEGEAFAVAQTTATTRRLPSVHVTLQTAKGQRLDFLPTNVDAAAHVVAPAWDGGLRVLPVEGGYDVTEARGRALVRGAPYAGGLVSMRVGLTRRLPEPVGVVEIAQVEDPVQRPVREANVPAPLVEGRRGPLAQLLCDAGEGPRPVPVGGVAHVPFVDRDSCRLVLHRERLDPREGTQKLALDLDVTRIDGAPRSEARVSRVVTLEPGAAPRVLWLHGAEGRFDRYSVRLSHVADDRHYDLSPEIDSGLPGAQWSVITGRGFARLYATTAIPTGMYRVSDRDSSGILTLNFGVIGRLTWLDSLGHEGLLALEAGVMAVGLANDTSPTGRSLTQVATVAGLGFSVPIANRGLVTETAVNLHAWVEYEPSRAIADQAGNPLAFVFGPSISIGNLGADF